MLKLVKNFIDWIGRFQVVQSILEFTGFAIPLSYGLVSGLLGYISHQNWMEIMFFSSGGAMFILAIMFLYILYTERKNPENKLKFIGPQIKMDLVKAKTNTARRIERIQVGFQMRNDAFFPIYFYVASAETSLEDKSPPRGKFPRGPAVIGPSGLLTITDDAIELDGRLCGNISGEENIVIKYGNGGKERYELVVKGILTVAMLPSGAVTSIQLGQVTQDL